VNSLFFLLSGEHETLPAAEVLAILESEGYKYQDVRFAPKLLTLTADRSCIEKVVKRAGMCNLGGLTLFQTENCENEIFRRASEVLYLDHLGYKEKFIVRTLRLFGSSRHLDRKRIESVIGGLISAAVPTSIVDPVRYNKEFLGIIGEKFLFGIVVSRSHRLSLTKHAPKLRPAIHPSTIQPKLARSLVNLARARPGDTFIDPFCGVGGILIEAAAIGCRVVGSDISPEMVKKSLLNFRYLKLEPYGLLVADAKNLPYPRVFSLATDPPYGRASSTHGAEQSTLIRGFLREIKNIIMPGRFLCLASPSNINICRLGYEEGFTLVERHAIRVHKSLTREIAVFSIKKKDFT